jgi:hypothetical protein
MPGHERERGREGEIEREEREKKKVDQTSERAPTRVFSM